MEVYPAADRNKHVIFEQLAPLFQSASHVLEVCSGTGQHITYFASRFPDVIFHPTELDTNLFNSIQAYINHAQLSNVHSPQRLDVRVAQDWKALDCPRCQVVVTTNLLHISPWEATVGLFTGAANLLVPHGHLCIYGAFKKDGQFTTVSNQKFDASLRRSDSSWGLRDIHDVAQVASTKGFQLVKTVDMPANNFMLFFRKESE
ncbi:hypothetical protein IWQ62_002472 [Dispira parvispora]|uniref:SAM-dependent methyltransferase n=1 Tax=Dispira parvispora TaxID=1520584 RepID=A0A9W8ATQ2_9FUNG|nr:hypothetical protein IWQ62_002472 [Dispira parvispora]